MAALAPKKPSAVRNRFDALLMLDTDSEAEPEVEDKQEDAEVSEEVWSTDAVAGDWADDQQADSAADSGGETEEADSGGESEEGWSQVKTRETREERFQRKREKKMLEWGFDRAAPASLQYETFVVQQNDSRGDVEEIEVCVSCIRCGTSQLPTGLDLPSASSRLARIDYHLFGKNNHFYVWNTPGCNISLCDLKQFKGTTLAVFAADSYCHDSAELLLPNESLEFWRPGDNHAAWFGCSYIESTFPWMTNNYKGGCICNDCAKDLIKKGFAKICNF
jgi:hypothetical protein